MSNFELIPSNNNRPNYFESQIFYNEIDIQNFNNEKTNKSVEQITNLLLCSICNHYLEDPMYDPSCCEHYACKKCLEKSFKKKFIIKCPKCRRNIRKKDLKSVPGFESIKSIINDLRNSKFDNYFENAEEMCDAHPNNQIFCICLDCRKKMCPICNNDKEKHNGHHIVNYERYKKLFIFFQENFVDIKKIINQKNDIIKEYQELNILLDQQLNGYYSLFNDILNKIKTIYEQNMNKINNIISNSMKEVANLRNFMQNIKGDISSRFKDTYDDIENFDNIKQEIKQKIDSLNLKGININKNEVIEMKKKCNKKIIDLPKKEIMITLNKNILMNNLSLQANIDKDGNETFGAKISEDKKEILFFLDIKKVIKNELNEGAYISYIEYGNNKKIEYLEPHEINQDYYSFEKILPIEQIFNNNENKISIKMTINYLTIK